MTTLQLQCIKKSFVTATGAALKVLEDFTLTVPDGQFVCVLGPSGSGKSTILNILAGLYPPDAGEVFLGGVSCVHGIKSGYVFQRPRLLNWRTVRENIYFALRGSGVSTADWRDRADSYLRLVGLDGFEDEFPLRLSGGMQQRVAIARAWAIEPKILLMDEPFSSLDEFTAGELRQELLRIWGHKRQTILFVTHNAREAAILADRIVVTSRRPARILADIAVDIARPREPTDFDVVAVERQVVSTILSHMQEHGLAQAPVGDVIGAQIIAETREN